MDGLLIVGFLVIVIWIVGIVGNLLSAIVWLRRQVASKNSSAVYLAAIAINDILHLLTVVHFFILSENYTQSWAAILVDFVHWTSYMLEPLLVCGFSAERLYAIRRPLQVRFV